MQKEKSKNNDFWQAGTLPFVALWAGSSAAAWVGVVLLADWISRVSGFTQQQTNLTALGITMLAGGLMQVQIVERLLKRSMRGWMLYTLIGTLVTFVTFRDGIVTTTYIQQLLVGMSLLLPTPLIQGLWLRRHVKSTWLWVLASVVASIVFFVPLTQNTAQSFLLGGLMHGLIMGGVMRYLWTQPKDDEKAKVDVAANDDAHEARVERLQEITQTDAIAPSSQTDNTSRQTKG